MHRTKLTLANICGGAVQEKIDRAMEKVARNILDPNTSNKEKRVITLKITFTPKEDDIENIHVNAEVNTKLSMENGVSVQTQFRLWSTGAGRSEGSLTSVTWKDLRSTNQCRHD